MTLSFDALPSIVESVLPGNTVEWVQPVICGRPQRIYNVQVTDGRSLVLELSPHPVDRLMRSEQFLILSQTRLVSWITETLYAQQTAAANASWGGGVAQAVAQLQLNAGHSAPGFESYDLSQDSIIRYLPMIVAYSFSAAELGSPFCLSEPVFGIPIAELPSKPTSSQRKALDFQKGCLVRELSEVTSPDGTFGPAVTVLEPQQQPAFSSGSGGGSSSYGGSPQTGALSWATAFHALLEAVLRDGEDMAITMSYAPIRSHLYRLGHVLDAVTVARLVVLDAADDHNVLVYAAGDPTASEEAAAAAAAAATAATTSTRTSSRSRSRRHGGSSSSNSNHANISEGPSASRSSQRATAAAAAAAAAAVTELVVSGVRDWSDSVFGDPLIGTAFRHGPSAEFLGGFRRCPGTGTDDEAAAVVEDQENAPVRLLLYECYHAARGVVRQFYRQGGDSSQREIAARRRLAAVLGRLEQVDERAIRVRGGGSQQQRSRRDVWAS